MITREFRDPETRALIDQCDANAKKLEDGDVSYLMSFAEKDDKQKDDGASFSFMAGYEGDGALLSALMMLIQENSKHLDEKSLKSVMAAFIIAGGKYLGYDITEDVCKVISTGDFHPIDVNLSPNPFFNTEAFYDLVDSQTAIFNQMISHDDIKASFSLIVGADDMIYMETIGNSLDVFRLILSTLNNVFKALGADKKMIVTFEYSVVCIISNQIYGDNQSQTRFS